MDFCLHVCLYIQYCQQSEKSVIFSDPGVADGCEPLYGY